jgi:hypothetical protein
LLQKLSYLCFADFRNCVRFKREFNSSWSNAEDSGHFSLEGQRGNLLLEKGRETFCRSCGNKSDKSVKIDFKSSSNTQVTAQEGLLDDSVKYRAEAENCGLVMRVCSCDTCGDKMQKI